MNSLSIKRAEIHQMIFRASCMGIAFFLPVSGRIVPIWIILLVLNWLISGKFTLLFSKRQYRSGQSNILLFGGFYVLYLLGLYHTVNFDYAFFDLEIKLSLLLFPLVFFTYRVPPFDQGQLKSVLYAFLAGCLTGSSILLVHAAFNQVNLNQEGSFYYTRLAWYFHTSYFAMYLTFAVAVINISLLDRQDILGTKALLSLLLSCFFAWMIILLSSKAGILALIMVMALSVILAGFYARNRILTLLISAAGIFILVTGWKFSPGSYARFSATEKAMTTKTDTLRQSAESNADRLMVWTTALKVIRENPIFGVGTGDVKDALLAGYEQNGAIPALQHKLNAHSQFLQTFVTLGITGILCFILMFILPAFYAFRKKQWIYLFFLLVFVFNCLTESMLEVQAGVVFYAFFNILLFTAEKKQGPGIPEPC